MRFVFIQAHARIFHITTMCRVLEVSKAGYYAWRARPLSERVKANRQLLARIRVIHAQVKGRYGSPRVHQELRALGLPCGQEGLAKGDADARIPWRQGRGAARAGEGLGAIAQLRAQMGRLLQQLEARWGVLEAGLDALRSSREVSGELEDDRAHESQFRIARRSRDGGFESRKGDSRIAAKHPPQLREVAMGTGVSRPQLQALQEQGFGLVEAPLLVQRAGQHEVCFRGVEPQRERAPRSALRIGCMAQVALGSGQVVPGDGVAGIPGKLRSEAGRVGRPVARHR